MGMTEHLSGIDTTNLEHLAKELEVLHLAAVASSSVAKTVSIHPLVQHHFYRRSINDFGDSTRELHRRLFAYYKNWPMVEEPSRQMLEPYYLAVYHGDQGRQFDEAFKFYYEQHPAVHATVCCPSIRHTFF